MGRKGVKADEEGDTVVWRRRQMEEKGQMGRTRGCEEVGEGMRRTRRCED